MYDCPQLEFTRKTGNIKKIRSKVARDTQVHFLAFSELESKNLPKLNKRNIDNKTQLEYIYSYIEFGKLDYQQKLPRKRKKHR